MKHHLILGAIGLTLLIALIIAAWSTIVMLSSMLLWVILVILTVTGISLLIYKAAMAYLSIVERRQGLRHANEKHELERELALTLLNADALGNYPIYLPRQPLQIAPVVFAPGNSVKGQHRVQVTEVEPEEPPLLVSPQVIQPSMRSLLAQLEPNALQVSPGVRADTGLPVILRVEDAVHFKLIGSSGFGKSCLAAALIDQAISLNAPDMLQVALLDLEHKTSRLFEDSANVATLQVGKRVVPMVATTADEVALYLGYLKSELDRRARLSETDLQAEPILLIYVEEMLSLQYEVDEKLLNQMLAHLSVLAVRARKYRMPLLACAQTDYSTPDLKTAQKQFRTRIAFAVDTTAARAAGFMSTDLIKYNFTNSQKGDGQFVLESPGVASLMLAPVYDVKQKLLNMERSAGAHERDTPPALHIVNGGRTATEPLTNGSFNDTELSWEAKVTQVQQLRALKWGKEAIIRKIWGAKKGGNKAYQIAEPEYEQIVSWLVEREA